MVITTAQLYSTKPKLRFCAGSNPAHGVSEIRDDQDLWQWSRLKIRLNAFFGQPYHKNNSSIHHSSKENFSVQLALNYFFCCKTPPPTHWQLQHSKLKKIKLDLLSLTPLVFNRRFTLIRIEKQVYISPSGKQSCITEKEQWLASRQATSTCSLLLT